MEKAQDKVKKAQDKEESLIKINEEAIIDFCKEAKSLKEIIEKFGYKNIRRFREKYINEMLKKNSLKQTIPNKPTSRNQKYIATKL